MARSLSELPLSDSSVGISGLIFRGLRPGRLIILDLVGFQRNGDFEDGHVFDGQQLTETVPAGSELEAEACEEFGELGDAFRGFRIAKV
ncbi:hypothetical protein ABIE21_003269 [Conyzicola nivalis]|uniref:Uncharacterized protein n=1 Tax=Conyzicola nivalis TaxID=1477021 RepID=A0ABV2QTE2_9MICO